MRARALEHLLSLVVVTGTLIAALVFVQGRGVEVTKAGALTREVAGLEGLNLDDAFGRAALADVLDIFYPGQTAKNAATVASLERHRQSSLVRNLSQSNVKERLTWRKSGQIAAMYAKFLLVYALVMVLTYYGVETIGVWRFVLRRRRVMSAPERLRTLPQRARRLVFNVVSFVASFILFCPAYVLAYTMRTEFGTDSIVFMVLLGVVSNGLLMMYSNKFYTFLITESRKGYVETALAKNLNASYARGAGGISRSAMLRPLKRFDGHVFGHIFRNARLQYISSIKEQASFLITGLIIVEMALNIHGHLNYEMLRQILYRNYDIVIAIILCIFYTVKGTEVAVDVMMHRAAMRYENT